MSRATLTINSRNYGAWSLRGWLMCKISGLDFEERVVASDDPDARAELLLLSPSFLVPRLDHDGITVWDTMAIGEYLSEILPDSALLPKDRVERARCRSISAEMHAGFIQLRSALPMNVKARFRGFTLFSGAQADVDRILAIWKENLGASGGPYLFGDTPCLADAMYAPVCTRFLTYGVDLPEEAATYVDSIMELPEMHEWVAGAELEPDALDELDAEF